MMVGDGGDNGDVWCGTSMVLPLTMKVLTLDAALSMVYSESVPDQ